MAAMRSVGWCRAVSDGVCQNDPSHAGEMHGGIASADYFNGSDRWRVNQKEPPRQ